MQRQDHLKLALFGRPEGHALSIVLFAGMKRSMRMKYSNLRLSDQETL